MSLTKVWSSNLSNGQGVFATTNYLYVADDTSGLRIYNITPPNPFPLVQTGNYKHPAGKSKQVFVEGNFAYLANESAGLVIVNISNPAAPTFVSSLSIGNASYVYVASNYAYLIVSDSLKIVNVTNPAAPSLSGVYKPAPTAYPQGLYVRNGIVFLAENGSGGGLEVVNATNPASPIKINLYTYQGFVYDVASENDLLYVGEGLRIHLMNITNPAAPVFVRTDTVGGKASVIDVKQSFVFAKDGQELKVYSNKYLQASYNVNSFIYDVDAGANNYVYVAGDSLTIFKWLITDIKEKELLNSFSLLQNYPNPFNPSTRIKYSIEKSQYVSLTVYDVLGNEVEILVNKEIQAGNYEVEWNASQNPCGIYFYHLKADGKTLVKKMCLIK
jgi:hypothetical protein